MMSTVETMPPEALLDDFPPPMQAIANRLRAIVRTAIPDVVERVRPGWRLIGYDLPIGRNGVYIAFVSPEVEHVHLGFEHGWAMHDPRGLLQGRGITKRVRWLTFTTEEQVDDAACAELLGEAIRVATMTRDERMLRSMDRESREG